MHSLFAITALAFSAGLGVNAQASSPAQLVSQLKTAASANDRLNLLSQDSDFVFNFNNASATKGAGGETIAASVSNFPVLTNQGLAMTVGYLGPCGMNTPHTHPRATEMLYLVNGTLETGMLDENGARFVYNTINAGSAAVFLKGSIHYQLNFGCEPVQFVAALNNEDPGVLSVAQRYFGLPPDIVGASLGDLGVQDVAGLEKAIPDNIALGTAECLAKCNIKGVVQPTNQRQPRVAANALPSGFSGPTPPAAAPPAPTAHSRRSLIDDAPVKASSERKVTMVVPEIQIVDVLGQNVVNLALLGVVALMASGYVVIALVYARSRGRAQYAAPIAPVVMQYADRPSAKSAL